MTNLFDLSEAEAANRLMRLAKEIAKHNRAYHAEDAPTISDADYDALVRENNALEAAFPHLIRADSPNKQVGASVASSALAKVTHEKRMMSRDNAFADEDVAEFVAYVRQNGDKVKQAHGGIGASSHMACLLFTSELGLKPTLVAYRGTGPAVNDLVGGHVDFLCEQSVSVAEQIKAGTIKGYVVSAAARLPALPDVPSAKEAGINYDMSIWAGIFAPKGVSKEVVDKLAAALDKALDDPTVQKRLGELGASIPPKSERNPATFDRLVKGEIARWSPILKAASGSTN